jgi:hypothetical protein
MRLRACYAEEFFERYLLLSEVECNDSWMSS